MSDDPWLERTYDDDPDACDLSDLMVIENVISGHKDIIALFFANKLGVDVDVGVFRSGCAFSCFLMYNVYRTIIVSSRSRDQNAGPVPR